VEQNISIYLKGNDKKAIQRLCDSVSNMITVSRVLRIAVRFALANIDEFKKFVERDIE